MIRRKSRSGVPSQLDSPLKASQTGFGWEPSAFNGTTAEERMLKSINDQLVELFGSSGAQALNYHVDPKTAPQNPFKYQEEMRLLFGPMSTKIIHSLRDELCAMAEKTPAAWCEGIENCLKCLKQNVGTNSRQSETKPLAIRCIQR
jgi:hypothetical protein